MVAIDVNIGVLAMQGAFLEHETVLQRLGCRTEQVRQPEQLQGLQGLIIPGGESTTIGMLLERFHLAEVILQQAEAGMPIWGTCAGLILLAREIVGSDQFRLGLMDMKVERNAFGRQIHSFEALLSIHGFADPFPGVFIRAPHIVGVGKAVQVLASCGEKIVAACQGQFLATAFHPELSGDDRMHRLFLEIVLGRDLHPAQT